MVIRFILLLADLTLARSRDSQMSIMSCIDARNMDGGPGYGGGY